MTTYAVCTALYEAARPYLPAYIAGLGAAAAGEDVRLVVAVDDLQEPGTVIGALREICPVSVVHGPRGATPARVRRSLIAEAVATPVDILIFADMDDVLSPAAPGLHRDALSDAAFSFGDMSLIDAAGNSLGRRFFAGAGVPWRLDNADALLDRNFLGLSNTAVRREALPDTVLSIPDDIVAVDWWLFTSLLMTGRKGQRIPEAVSDYRTYGNNILGAGALSSRDELMRFLEVARRHYRAFPGSPMHAVRGARVEALVQEVAGWTAHELAVALATMGRNEGVWFGFLNTLMSPRDAAAPASVAS